MKKFLAYGIAAAMLFGSVAYAGDFTVTVPYTDEAEGELLLTVTGTVDENDQVEITSVTYEAEAEVTDELKEELTPLILEAIQAQAGTEEEKAPEMEEIETPAQAPAEMEEGETPAEAPAEMEEGEAPAGAPAEMGEGETPPEKPEGDSQMGTPPDGQGGPGGEGHGGPGGESHGGPGGEGHGGPGGNGQGGNGGGFGGNTPPGGGGSSSDFTYTALKEITEAAEITGETYSTETVDESALIVNTTEDVILTDITVEKTGDSNGGDSCNFYGLNASLLAMGGGTTTITGGSVTSDASGANGVFCYGGNGASNGENGDGTTVYVSDMQITTTGSGSGGIMTTGGGVTYATNLTVETSGGSSAPIRTDRGGGTVVVDGGTYTSNGLGSPAIYSTADITVSNATLTSNLSEGVCIEGKNSITLVDCDMTANNTKCNGHATFMDTIMIYQSMSGDADSGTSSFTMTGGSLTSKNGHMFHVTNTHAIVNLSGVELVNEGSDVLLSVCDDGWSGADNIAELNADGQVLAGQILVGDNSTLTFAMTNGTTFEGCISGQIENVSGETVSTEVGTVNVTLDETSTWTLTADTSVTSFEGNLENVNANGFTLYVNGEAVN